MGTSCLHGTLNTTRTQLQQATMKLSSILFAFVCLGLLALALAHADDDHNNKSDNKDRDWDWDWKNDKDSDCDEDNHKEDKCYWKCVKECPKKPTSTRKHYTTSTATKECPRETTSTTT